MFETCLSEYGHEDEANVIKLVKLFQANLGTHKIQSLCSAVEQLSNVPRSERVQCFKHCGNINFRIWSRYMDMVEILLDFTGAERDGNWTLHVETFAVMQPRLTIYARSGSVYLADMKLIEDTRSWKASQKASRHLATTLTTLNVTDHFRSHTTTVDVVFDRSTGQQLM